MSRHLSPEESVAALEHTLEPARLAHVEACDRCRSELAGLGQMLTDVEAAVDDSEPSPRFWDHFSDRVRAAVPATPHGSPSWRRLWQPVAGLAAAALLGAWLVGREVPGEPPPAQQTASVSSSESGTEGLPAPPWDAVVELAAALSVDEVHGAVPSGLDAVVLFDELTADEQAALIELLEREMEGLE